MARKAGKRRSTDLLTSEPFVVSRDWATPDKLPWEAHVEDIGWQAGPLERELPPFKGPAPGPTNPLLAKDSSEEAFMDELLTTEFKVKCKAFTAAHVRAWREKHKDRLSRGSRPNRVDHAFHAEETFLLGDGPESNARFTMLFDTWVATKLRVAQLKPEIPASALWGRVKTCASLYDAELDSVLTYEQYLWCNRHMSFADCPDAEAAADEAEAEMEHDDDAGDDDLSAEGEDDADDGEEPAQAVAVRTHDTFRTRRELTDLVNAAFARAFPPHQHIGLDEGVRSTKHWEKQRVRFKASVHSGTLVDMLNDCKTSYCLWFQEQTWNSK